MGVLGQKTKKILENFSQASGKTWIKYHYKTAKEPLQLLKFFEKPSKFLKKTKKFFTSGGPSKILGQNFTFPGHGKVWNMFQWAEVDEYY